MTGGLRIIAGWSGHLDWVLFLGLVAWCLAAAGALRMGGLPLGRPRERRWLLIGAYCGLAAIGQAVLLLHYYGLFSGRMLAGIFLLAQLAAGAVLLPACAGILPRLGAAFWVAVSCGVGLINLATARFAISEPAAGSAVLAGTTSIFLSVAGVAGWLAMEARQQASLPAAPENRVRLQRKAIAFALVVAGVIAAGFVASRSQEKQIVADQSERLIWRVRTAALGLNMDAILRLSGQVSDRKMPAYANVVRQLEKILAANADVRNAFLWSSQRGELVFLAHKSAGGTEFFPGGMPADLRGGLAGRFENDEPSVVLSVRDGPVVFLTALQSVANPTNRRPYAWLALDFDPLPWVKALAEARLQVLSGTLIAALLVTAGYGWMTRLEIERDSEREKLALVEAERQRFARDLHDGLGQTLTGLAFRARALAGSLAGPSAQQVLDLSGMLSAAVGEARAIAQAEIPPSLRKGGLRGGLEWLADRTEKLFGVHFRLDLPDPLPELSEKSSHALLQIAREAAHNAIRHGRAEEISVSLEREPGGWRFDIRDNGEGLKTGEEISPGLGRRMIAARLKELGGSVEFLPNPPTGLLVRCRFPALPAES